MHAVEDKEGCVEGVSVSEGGQEMFIVMASKLRCYKLMEIHQAYVSRILCDHSACFHIHPSPSERDPPHPT